MSYTSSKSNTLLIALSQSEIETLYGSVRDFTRADLDLIDEARQEAHLAPICRDFLKGFVFYPVVQIEHIGLDRFDGLMKIMEKMKVHHDLWEILDDLFLIRLNPKQAIGFYEKNQFKCAAQAMRKIDAMLCGGMGLGEARKFAAS